MNISSSNSMEIPTTEDFEILKDAFFELASSVWATVKNVPEDPSGLYISAEKLCADVEFLAWPPYSICLSGIIRTYHGGNSMVLRYRELAHNSLTNNSSINHDYVLRSEFGELTEFGHSIRACPEISSPSHDIDSLSTDDKLDQIDLGTKIIKQNIGNQLELTAGDCDILFDRITDFLL